MTVAQITVNWLLLVFRLPARRATERVDIWRKLRRTGALALKTSGYLLPATPANRERFEWLATSIRRYKGEASVIEVHSIDGLGPGELARRFTTARAKDYESLLAELKRWMARTRRPATGLARMRRKFQEIEAIDFFPGPMRGRVAELLAQVDTERDHTAAPRGRSRAKSYRGRTWVTRPAPGIDRVASAWLIRRYIDPRAKFAFSSDPRRFPEAIPFDMFGDAGFGHRGDDCTFETLRKEFAIRDAKVRLIAEIVHDADLEDEKFGRAEGFGLHSALGGWARQGVADDELLRRGMDLIEGLYHGVSK